jgi:branched-chain amino acid transport system ATP-binding protein
MTAAAAARLPESDSTSAAARVVVEGLTVSYDKIVAVPDLSFTVEPGRALAILGPNGAGKTTTANALSGLIPSTARRLELDGEDIGGLTPDKRARRGVGHLPDRRAIFPTLTVADNLRMAFNGLPRSEIRARVKAAYEWFPELERRQRLAARRLSGGEQQMLAFARLIVKPPRMLIVDEPSHGLSPRIVSSLFESLAELKGRTTMIVIEQFVTRAVELADDVIVLSHGEVTHQGPADELTPEMAAELYSLS